MDRRLIKTLIVNDDDLNCDCEKITIKELSTEHVGFSAAVLKDFEMVVYSGKKGDKILKSFYTKTGEIK